MINFNFLTPFLFSYTDVRDGLKYCYVCVLLFCCRM